MSHDRVTDENAPVRIVGNHPVARVPNRLTEQDWKGWVQERGLYFAQNLGPPLPAGARDPRSRASRRCRVGS